MANILKKLVAGISAAAVLATVAVIPAFAETGDVLETWDYSTYTTGANNEWSKQNTDVNESIAEDGYLVLKNSADSSPRTASKTFNASITGSCIVEYDLRICTRGNNPRYITIGKNSSDYLVKFNIPSGGGGATINDTPVSLTVSNYFTEWMHIEHQINAITNKITTTIESDSLNTSFDTGYAVSGASEEIGMVYVSLAKTPAEFDIKKLTVKDYEVVLTDAELLDAIMNDFNLDEDQRGMTKNDDVYTVTKNVTLPSSETATSVDWELTQRPINDETAAWTETTFASVDGNTLVLNATDESADYYVKAKVTIAVNDETATKEFMFVVTPLVNNKYPGSIEAWDYEFDDADWTLGSDLTQSITDSGDTLKIVNGSNSSSRTAYKDFVNPTTSSAKVEYDIQSYSRGQNVSNTLYLGVNSSDYLVKISFPQGAGSAEINGNATATLTGASNYTSPWLHITNTFNFIAGTVKTEITDASGDTIFYSGTSEYDPDATEKIARFTVDLGKSSNSISIKDVVVWAYEPTAQEMADYAYSVLDITSLTKTNDVYTAAADFEIPSAPGGTTVTWKAMQKAKTASEWTDSSFITVSGTKATINPTSEIDNYDVKLVATIISGDVVVDKEFVIDLPNPMDEITGIIADELPTVNTTDKNTAGNTITFDLSGTDVLKYDLALPVKSKTYKNTTIAWKSSDSDHISIAADGTATIMTSDLRTHEVTLTAVATYKKGSVTYSSAEQKYTVTMGYTSADVESSDATLAKYKVRFDAAYDDNFDVPSSTSTHITLLEEGYFGSTISWSSNAPSVISAKGKFTKPSSSKTVKLTAKISCSGTDDKLEKVFSVSVNVKSSGGGGGGGSSTSSTGTSGSGTSNGSIASSTSAIITSPSVETTEDRLARLREEAAAANDLFTDIGKATWAREAINGLAAAGVINGKSDTEFAPNDNVTRAEFAKILMGTFGLASNAYTTSSFRDVPTDAWYFEYVESAYNLGIITGVGNGTFAPDALITRQDMAVMVARAAEMAGKTISEVSEAKDFADSGNIADYAKAPVDTLVKGGVINGMSDTEFAPLANATRAQAAKILYNFL